jgi:diadenosine tetraphosphate (Ap4A) HIT family hydrolase
MVDNPTSGQADAVPRRPIDAAAYDRRSREGPCFVCETLAGNPDYPGHVVWADDHSVALLARYNTLLGHTLVAPRAHREQVTVDFTLREYLNLQRLVYQVGEALRRELPTERLYIMSLGSQSGNRHVHWHVAPCRPGFPTSSSSSPPSPGSMASWTCPSWNSPASPSASARTSNGCGSTSTSCPRRAPSSGSQRSPTVSSGQSP